MDRQLLKHPSALHTTGLAQDIVAVRSRQLFDPAPAVNLRDESDDIQRKKPVDGATSGSRLAAAFIAREIVVACLRAVVAIRCTGFLRCVTFLAWMFLNCLPFSPTGWVKRSATHQDQRWCCGDGLRRNEHSAMRGLSSIFPSLLIGLLTTSFAVASQNILAGTQVPVQGTVAYDVVLQDGLFGPAPIPNDFISETASSWLQGAKEACDIAGGAFGVP